MDETVNRILDALRSIRVPAVPGEYDIHGMVAEALRDAQIPFSHEVSLSPGRRVDFISDCVGIEVKKSRPQRSKLIAQAEKYLASPRLQALIVVSQKNVSLPRFIAGKPVYLLSLDRLWGVSLP